MGDATGQDRVLNVLQLVMLNMIFFVLLTVTGRLLGQTWTLTLGLSWGGASLLTVIFAAFWVFIQNRRVHETRTISKHRRPSRPTARSNQDLIAEWDADGDAELRQTIAQTLAWSNDKAWRPHSKDMVKLWEEDANADRAEDANADTKVSGSASGKRQRRM